MFGETYLSFVKLSEPRVALFVIEHNLITIVTFINVPLIKFMYYREGFIYVHMKMHRYL